MTDPYTFGGNIYKYQGDASKYQSDPYKYQKDTVEPMKHAYGTGIAPTAARTGFDAPGTSVANNAAPFDTTGKNNKAFAGLASNIDKSSVETIAPTKVTSNGLVEQVKPASDAVNPLFKPSFGGKLLGASAPALTAGFGVANEAMQTPVTPETETYSAQDEFNDTAAMTATTLGGAAASAVATGAIASGITGIGAGAASGAATGAAAGPWGAVIGAVIGLAVGAFGIGAKRRQIARQKEANTKVRNREQYINEQSRIAAKEAQINAQSANDAKNNPDTLVNASNTTAYGEQGGLLPYANRLDAARKKKSTPITRQTSASALLLFRSGGQIRPTHNIIPNGVLHKETNTFGDGGMPIVQCDDEMKSCQKKFEIERDELIFTKATTVRTNLLVKNKKFKELGSFLTKQILDNTHSFTDKYQELN